MFNDGYDLFCSEVISKADAKHAAIGLDQDVICGCLDYVKGIAKSSPAKA